KPCCSRARIRPRRRSSATSSTPSSHPTSCSTERSRRRRRSRRSTAPPTRRRRRGTGQWPSRGPRRASSPSWWAQRPARSARRSLTAEAGKPFAHSRGELAGLRPRIDFFVGRTALVLAEQIVLATPDIEERIRQEPLGVVANVSAWNYPWFVGANAFIPALLTG